MAEAVCARDADKLECLLRAVWYRVRGMDAQAWIDTSPAVLKTDSVQCLAGITLERQPLAWMHEVRDVNPEVAVLAPCLGAGAESSYNWDIQSPRWLITRR